MATKKAKNAKKAKYTYRKRTNELSVRVARRIKALRSALGLTQYEFAEQCGVSQGMVNKWEGRLVPIDLEDLEKIAGVLGVKPHQLLAPRMRRVVERTVSVPVAFEERVVCEVVTDE